MKKQQLPSPAVRQLGNYAWKLGYELAERLPNCRTYIAKDARSLFYDCPSEHIIKRFLDAMFCRKAQWWNSTHHEHHIASWYDWRAARAAKRVRKTILSRKSEVPF